MSLRRYIAAGWLAVAAVLSSGAEAQQPEGLNSGEAYLTRFSGTVTKDGASVIDTEGVVGSVVDLRTPGIAPKGSQITPPQRLEVTAGQVGQVFGVAIGGGETPSVYLAATSAFGLHRTADNSDWMPGMWGADGAGPGSVFVLSAENNFEPSILADVVLDGRQNTGPGLGNIAYDSWHDQLFVSDLETGMIHRLRASDGYDLGHYDHGVEARPDFVDVQSGQDEASLPEVAFDPNSAAHITDCPSGAFAETPSCWNFADFRRRVYGLGVMRDPVSQQVRLYYSIWGSQGFDSTDYAAAGDEQRNSVWSVGITDDGNFDIGDIRREFFLPDFFSRPEDLARAGHSNPVADIAISTVGEKPVMLLAERGGVRNLGLDADAPFAYPREARVLRYELGDDDKWQPVGRYDVGQYDRKEEGMPFLRANAAGGVAFGPGYDDTGKLDLEATDGFVWMTGDGLCSAAGPCVATKGKKHTDASDVDGLQGGSADNAVDVSPEAASQPYPASGFATPATGPDSSYVADADADTKASDATRIGDVAIYQAPSDAAQIEQSLAEFGSGGEALEPEYEPPYEPQDPGYDPYDPPGGGWPVPPPVTLDTDLGIVKSGPVSCQKGTDCHYTLKVTNLGPAPYHGVIAINDTMPAGATLSSSSPGWHCTVTGPVVSCATLGFADLPVGVPATLELVVLLPAVIATPTVQNCGAIDWFEMGTDDGPGDIDDISCIDTPVTDGFDLGVEKIPPSPAECVENAICQFQIKVTNFGPGTFSGALVVKDTLPAGVTFVSGNGCTALGSTLSCQKSPVTMNAGDSYWFNGIRVKLPVGIPPGGTIENCVDIDWTHMGADDGTPDVHADHACATVTVKSGAGFFDLGVEKTGPASCDPGGDCKYTVTVTNHGPDNYIGGIEIRDKHPASMVWTSYGTTDGWICSLHSATRVYCSLGGPFFVAHPGDSFSFTLTFKLDNPMPAGVTSVKNCANFHWTFGVMTAADDNPVPGPDKPDKACAETQLDSGFDLQITKAGPAVCYEGKLCDYSISVTNNGPKPFEGLFVVKDTLPAGATVDSASDVTACLAAVGGVVTCGKKKFPLAPSTTHTFHLIVRLPNSVPTDTVKNCASLAWAIDPFGLGDTFTQDDKAVNDGPFCIDTPVLAADLAPFGGTVCEKGTTCTLDVSIDNRGGRLFKGSAGLRGTLNPAVHIRSVMSETSGLTCEVKGEGVYECNDDMLMLEAGTSARLKVTVDIPADFSDRRITHQKEMLWPDVSVKDAVPKDDLHLSTIMIKQLLTGPAAVRDTACPGFVMRDIHTGLCPGEAFVGDLLVTKKGDRDCFEAGPLDLLGDRSLKGYRCFFTLSITNTGSSPFTGDLWILDSVKPWTASYSTTAYDASFLTCDASFPDGVYCTTVSGGALQPGKTEEIYVTVWINEAYLPGKSCEVTNAATFGAVNGSQFGDASLTATDHIHDPRCGETLPTGQALIGDLLVKKTGGIECVKGPPPDPLVVPGRDGYNCQYTVSVTNTGGNAFSDTLTVGDSVAPRAASYYVFATPGSGTASVWDCPASSGGVQCTTVPGAVLPSAGTWSFTVDAWIDAADLSGNSCDLTNNAGFVVTSGSGKNHPIVGFGSLSAIDHISDERCVPAISLASQTIKSNTSLCQSGQLMQVRPDGFACVTTCDEGYRQSGSECVQAPTCTGGKFDDDGKCTCSKEGYIAEDAGDGNFVCEKPPLVCKDGIVRGGECYCPDNGTKKDDGNNQFHCEAPPTPEVTCTGGHVEAGKCVCDPGETRYRNGNNNYRCVAPETPEVICTGGHVEAGKCVCDPGETRYRNSSNNYRCVAPETPEVICTGGHVDAGKCVCDPGETRYRNSRNNYRCVAPETEITCTGGHLEGRTCVCDPGETRYRNNSHSFRCIAPETETQPEIVCQGGNVDGNQCYCPRNAVPIPVGRNKFLCVPLPGRHNNDNNNNDNNNNDSNNNGEGNGNTRLPRGLNLQ